MTFISSQMVQIKLHCVLIYIILPPPLHLSLSRGVPPILSNPDPVYDKNFMLPLPRYDMYWWGTCLFVMSIWFLTVICCRHWKFMKTKNYDNHSLIFYFNVGIGKLLLLEKLNVSNNFLKKLTPAISQLKSLTSLHLANNQLPFLPKGRHIMLKWINELTSLFSSYKASIIQ